MMKMTEGEKLLKAYALSLKYYCKSHDCMKGRCIFYHEIKTQYGIRAYCEICELDRFEGLLPERWDIEGKVN